MNFIISSCKKVLKTLKCLCIVFIEANLMPKILRRQLTVFKPPQHKKCHLLSEKQSHAYNQKIVTKMSVISSMVNYFSCFTCTACPVCIIMKLNQLVCCRHPDFKQTWVTLPVTGVSAFSTLISTCENETRYLPVQYRRQRQSCVLYSFLCINTNC